MFVDQGFLANASFSLTFILAYSLKCYICKGGGDTCSKDNLEKNKAKYAKTCTGDTNQCVRLWEKKDDKTTIANSCANDAGCTLVKDLCDEADHKCAVGCCKSDLCNASSPVLFSVFLMTVCFALGLALLK